MPSNEALAAFLNAIAAMSDVERAALGWAEMQTASQLVEGIASADPELVDTICRTAAVRFTFAALLVDESVTQLSRDWDTDLASLSGGGE